MSAAPQLDQVTLTFPEVLNLANTRHAHYMVQHKAVSAWKRRASIMEPKLRGGRPMVPWTRVRCRPVLYTFNRFDADNAAALKLAIDLLKGTWIIDDRAPYFELLLPVTQVIDRHTPRLELHLEKV